MRKSILAAALMIMGAIFVSAFAICMTVAGAKYFSDGGAAILLFIGGLGLIVAGAMLFAFDFKKMQ
ncbi:MAG: hypothetical protein FWE62_02975 [Firmicutes bacterium]|nr:hypothetical protein [Bacillota bacterium]